MVGLSGDYGVCQVYKTNHHILIFNLYVYVIFKSFIDFLK